MRDEHLATQRAEAPTTAVHKPAVAVVRIVLGLAFTYGVLAAVGLVISLVRTLSAGRYTVELPGAFDENTLPLPHTGSVVVDSVSRSTELTFSMHNVSGWLATLFIALAVLEFVIQASIAGSLVVLCLNVLDRRPFDRFLPGLLYAVAGVLAVAGSARELVQNAFDAQARHEITGGSPDTLLGSSYAYSFTGIWLVVALAVAAVAVVFQLGERLQRDTEGLV